MECADIWLEQKTVYCPVGKVSKNTCSMLAKRKSLGAYLKGSGRDSDWGYKTGGKKNEVLRPSVCEDCPGWEALFARQKREAAA